MIRTVSAALAAAFAFAAPAQAANVTAQDPQSVVAALHGAGYQAKLTKDDTGDPMIESTSGGSKFVIFFFNCTKNVDCRTVQFYAGYTEHKADQAKMNTWNMNNRFGRGYISSHGAANVEMDVDLDDGGISAQLFEDNVEYWVTVMSEFEKFVY
jgi:hypothetical protein